MVEGRKFVRIGKEGDYDVFYDDESGEVWFDVNMGEDWLMDDMDMEW